MPATTITHSDISAFLKCRRAWAWSFIDDVRKEERPVGAAALGKRVHSALEMYYAEGADPLTVHDALAREDITFLETTDAPGWEVDQLYTEMILGRNCVVAHQDWLEETGADAEFEVYGVEQTLEAPILGGLVNLRGRVDVLFKSLNDGRLYVNDWKTTGAQGSVRESFERSYQAHVYLALAAQEPDIEIGGAMYTVIRKTKNLARTTRPPVERFRVPATRRVAEEKMKQIERICTEMLRVIDEYSSDYNVAYPSPGDACRWCDYKQPCELQDENASAASAMLAATYQQGGKHARYDR